MQQDIAYRKLAEKYLLVVLKYLNYNTAKASHQQVSEALLKTLSMDFNNPLKIFVSISLAWCESCVQYEAYSTFNIIFNIWNNCIALYFVLSVPDKMIKDRINFFHEILRDWIADALNISLRMAKVLKICILPIRDRPRLFHKLIVFLIDSREFQLKVQFFSFFSITTKINT